MIEREAKIKNILVKVSGDLVDEPNFYEWLKENADLTERLTIICGGGSAITQSLEGAGIMSNFTDHGREIETDEGRELAAQVLYFHKKVLEKNLRESGIVADVIAPVLKLSYGFLHVNGDEMVRALQPNFDRTFVVTMNGKNKTIGELAKVEVVQLEISHA